MRNPLSWLSDLVGRRDPPGQPPPGHHVCTLSLAWARAQGVDDASLLACAERFRTSSLRFFERDEADADLIGDAIVPRAAQDEGDAWIRLGWDGEHLSIDVALSDEVSLDRGSVLVVGGYPEAWLTTVAGRPLGDVVAMPFPVGADIARVAAEGPGLIRIEIEPRWTIVPFPEGAD